LIDTFFFDWDGTLSDSAQQAFEAFRKTFAALGMPIEWEAYERVYTPDWYAMFEQLGLAKERWAEADDLWMQYYDHKAARMVPEGREVLGELQRKGYVTGIVTSGSRIRIEREIEVFGLTKILQVVICGEDVENKKPHPEGLVLAMQRAQKNPDTCCYVGDCPEDVEMGRSAGMKTVGISSRYPASRRLADARPDFCFASLKQFFNIIR
jgi:HAD superfamily hydrolase (TIGR01509 family)